MQFVRLPLKIIILSFLVMLTACSKNKVESEFAPILESFYQAAEARGLNVRRDNLSIHFGDTMPGATAQCVLSNARPESGGNEIIVNREGWYSYQDEYYAPEKEILLFHELGHCLLGLEHQEKTINLCDLTNENSTQWYKDVPLSIMKQNNFIEPAIYLKLREYYLDQLFRVTLTPLTQNIFKASSKDECGRQTPDTSASE